jgi:hypothetical protein
MLKWQRNNAHFPTFGFYHSFAIGHSSFSFEIFIRACHAEALAKPGVSRLESGCGGGELGNLWRKNPK